MGQSLIDGGPLGQYYDVKQEPTYITHGMFTSHGKSESFPRGAWAEINIWNVENPRFQLTVTGKYIAGTGPNARGILMPAGRTPIVYIHTLRSYLEGLPNRNFFIKQGRMDPLARHGLKALGMYLESKTPAKE